MLLFRLEEHVDLWCRATGEPCGQLLTLDEVWALSQAWYGDRMDPDFRGRTIEQAMAIFAHLGLISEFWRADDI